MAQDDTTAAELFVCNECGVRTTVDEEMEATLLEYGCIICTAAVSADDFEPLRER